MVTPSACAAEHNLMQRLQHEPESRTQRSCSLAHNTSSSTTTCNSSNSSNSSNTSCFGCRRSSLAQLWLLGVLLTITIAASSWPTGTSAAPRVARGAHLIWPHPNSSTEPAPATPKAPAAAAAVKAAHPHRRRLKARRQHHVYVRAAAKEPSVLIIKQTEGLTNCKAMEVTAKRRLPQLEMALKKAQSFKDTVICTTEDWLYNFYSGTNITNETRAFTLQHLELEHPLQEQVKNVTYKEEKFEYKGPVGSLEEEMPKIIETLLILETLIKSVTYDRGHYACTFKYLKDAVQSNTATAMELMKEQQCNAPKEIHYKSNVVRLPFFVALETIKVLTVLEYTYDKLLNGGA